MCPPVTHHRPGYIGDWNMSFPNIFVSIYLSIYIYISLHTLQGDPGDPQVTHLQALDDAHEAFSDQC